MADSDQLDRTFHFIMQHFVGTGRAPHFTDIAREFDVSPADGQRLLHDVMALGLPNWLFPDTDLIVSFAPFNNLPTHYRVSVDGEQNWFAQCGLESTAISWLFPGQSVQVDAPCLATGEPLRLVMRDGEVEGATPESMCIYVELPFACWSANLPFA